MVPGRTRPRRAANPPGRDRSRRDLREPVLRTAGDRPARTTPRRGSTGSSGSCAFTTAPASTWRARDRRRSAAAAELAVELHHLRSGLEKPRRSTIRSTAKDRGGLDGPRLSAPSSRRFRRRAFVSKRSLALRVEPRYGLRTCTSWSTPAGATLRASTPSFAPSRCPALRRGWKVTGIRRGYHGLLEPGPDGLVELTRDKVRGIAHLGGTILGTVNKGHPFEFITERDGKKTPSTSRTRSCAGSRRSAATR